MKIIDTLDKKNITCKKRNIAQGNKEVSKAW